MIEPTAEELSALQATHGAAMRLTSAIRAGNEQIRIAARVFDRESFDRYFDESLGSPSTAVENAFLRHLIWPTRDVCARLTMACASLPGFVIRALEHLASGSNQIQPAARFDILDAATGDAMLASIGLLRADAEKLLLQAGGFGVPLEMVALRGGGGLVLRAPEPVVYEQILAAMRGRKGAASAARVAAVASIAWCSEDVDGLLRRLPGLAGSVLMPELIRLGGADSDASFCFDG